MLELAAQKPLGCNFCTPWRDPTPLADSAEGFGGGLPAFCGGLRRIRLKIKTISTILEACPGIESHTLSIPEKQKVTLEPGIIAPTMSMDSAQ